MKFRPLHDRVLVRRIDRRREDRRRHHHPRHRQGKPMEGEVVAVGPGARNEKGELFPLDVKAGDRILFGKWSGSEVRMDGQDLLIMKESDIMGIVDTPRPAAKPPNKNNRKDHQ